MQLVRENQSYMNFSNFTNKEQNLLYIEYFLEMMAAEKSASKNTLDSYKSDLMKIADYARLKKVKFEVMSHQDIMNFIATLSQNNISSKSLARKISSIKQFFRFLASDNIRKDNPTLHIVMPKKEENLPKAISEAQMSLLIKASYSSNTNDGIRTAAMLEILYSTGMRVSELITLKMQSLERSLSNKDLLHYIIVKGKGNKERIVLLNAHATLALEKYLAVRNFFLKNSKSDWLFPSFTKRGSMSHFTRQRFGQILKELAIKAGLDPKLISPHKIRHSFATHMLNNGANLRVVQELLGHSDISSTQIYTKVSNKNAENLVLKKHPLATND